jgi:predicted GNAT family N-acyltransferase
MCGCLIFEALMTNIFLVDSADSLMPAAYALRHKVFVVEQGVPQELEIDEHDKSATHLVALSGGNVLGTLRIVRNGRTAKIGRMAVSASSRNKGIGRELMEFAAAAALADGMDEVVLDAQLTARDFYRRLGYAEEGPVFDDAGIPHVMMRRKLRT